MVPANKYRMNNVIRESPMDDEISGWMFDEEFTSSQSISPQITYCPIDFIVLSVFFFFWIML